MNKSLIENIYPENGSVVIVDDQIEEALPLMKVLSKLDIPFRYLSGSYDELPQSPFNNVRIVFLDIQLEGMDGVREDKTKLSTLANVINRIVSEKCSPYIIIAWTKHKELVNDINNYLNNDKKKPLLFLCIDKANCKDENGNFSLDEVSKELDKELKSFSSLKYFLFWQNLVNQAASIIVNDITSIADNQDEKLREIICLFARAYAGKQISDDIMGKHFMLSFNGLFLDTLENLIMKTGEKIASDEEEYVEEVGLEEADLKKITGNLNRRLLISLEENTKPVPGNIYEIVDEADLDKKKEFLSEIYNGKFDEKDNVIKDSILIELEVSPICDYAQNKWKKCRIMPGIIIPESFGDKVKKADYIYKSPLLELHNKSVYILFDIRHLTSTEIKNLDNKKSSMRIRKELLNDIQIKISAHISRLGVTNL